MRGARRNLRQRHTAIKRSRPRKDVHSRRVGLLSNARAGYFFFVSGGAQDMHRPSTAFPQPPFAAFVVLLLHHATSPACGLAGSAAGRGRSLSGPCGRPSSARRGDGSRRGRWRDDFPRVSHRRHLVRQLRRARPRRRPHRLLDADHRGVRKSAAPPREPVRRPRRLASHGAVRRCGTGREVLRGQRGSGLRGSHRPGRGRPRGRRRHHGSRPAAGHRRKGAENAGRVAADPLQLSRGRDPADARHARRDRRRAAGAERRGPVRSRVRGAVGDAGPPRAAAAAPDAEGNGRAGPGGRAAFGIVGGAGFAAVGGARRDRTRRRSPAERLAHRDAPRPADDRRRPRSRPIASISCSPRAFSRRPRRAPTRRTCEGWSA